MATAKIAISLDEGTVKRLDRLVQYVIFILWVAPTEIVYP